MFAYLKISKERVIPLLPEEGTKGWREKCLVNKLV
jgi:hypothetical protein